MERRTFLQAFAGVILCPWATATAPITRPIIFDYEDGGFLIGVDCLRCTIYPDSFGSVLDFGVWVTDYPNGMIRERLLLPSATLKKKLEEVGFTCVLEDDLYPFIVARLTHILTPHEVGTLLQTIVRGWDSGLLYYDPEAEASERLSY